MKKIILTLIIIVMFPTSVFAYTTTGTRSYSVPARSYSVPSYHPSAPSYHVSVPTTYNVSARSYTPPNTNTQSTNKPYTPPVVKTTNNTNIQSQTSWNPLSSNFWLWYLIFFNHNNNINNTHATTTRN